NGSENTSSVTVNRASSQISIACDNVTYGNNVSVDVSAVGNGKGLNGTATVTIGGEDYDVEVVNGSGSLEVPEVLPAGTYDISVSFTEKTGNYNGSENTSSVTVNRASSQMTVTMDNITAKDNISGEVSLIGNGVGLNGTVTVTIDNKEYQVEVVDGKGTIDLPNDLTPGEYTAKVEFEGNENYTGSEIESSFDVVKNIELSVDSINITYGDNEVVTIKTNVEVPINVTLTLTKIGDSRFLSSSAALKPGESTRVELEGSVDLGLGMLDAGQYRLTVSHENDDDSIVNSTVFTVSKANTTDELNIDNVVFGDDITGDVLITGAHGEGINGTATLTVAGKDYDVPLTNGKGSFSIPNDLPAGDHALAVAFNGNKNYNPSINQTSFSIDKAEPEMNVSTKVNGDSIEIDIKMPETVNKNVIVNVDGVNHTVVVENGIGKLTIPNVSSGKHDTTISFPGNENYTDKQISLNFTVPKNETDDGGNGAQMGDNAGKTANKIERNSVVEKTGNPILALLLVLMALPIRRIFKK
ncbi:MAG: Ig-like domain-containing protein, partial [Methanobrevibacter sp.]|uniref:Ig-like domain-containing protein n=1 Tax=Methanobrevibacter sp. TaxID=66852 RepID=UPI0026DFF7B4